MSAIIKTPDAILPNLYAELRSTFQGGLCAKGSLSSGARLYRYGSTRQQAAGSSRDWTNFSEDLLHTSEEVIQKLCLLDVTAGDLGEYHPGTSQRIPSLLSGSRGGGLGKQPRSWNTAAWRAEFRAKDRFPVWFGLAGPMAFDVFAGKRYRGSGDLSVHFTRPGGGSQVLVHRTNIPELVLFQVSELPRTPLYH